MSVKILYFAWIKEKVGTGEEHVELPGSVTTISDLMVWLTERSPGHREAFSDANQIRAAIDQTHVQHDASLGSASEIAFFPPVTGG
jgi:molybdopterin synthase sulfur carrier subunit